MPRGIPFKKGNKLAQGGKREGAGRPSDWLTKKCQELVDKNKILEFWAQVANGEEVDVYITENGAVIPKPASVKDRIRAGELLVERGFGKVPQGIEVPNGGEVSGVIIIRNPGTPCEK